jgi:anhydro-N-acetylmuramic acid kinase
MAMQITRSMCSGNALISGGGSHNTYLIERIKDLSKNEIQVADPIIIDFKEALIFAYLGYLRLSEKINVLSSVTGASRDHIAGSIHLP